MPRPSLPPPALLAAGLALTIAPWTLRPARALPAAPAQAGAIAAALLAAAPPGGAATSAAAATRPAAAAPTAAGGAIVNCGGKPVQRPGEILISCADGGIMITGIRWSRWSAGGASGSGTLVVNSCIYNGGPACMAGRNDSYRAELILGQPVAAGPGRALFSELRLRFPRGGPAGLASGSYRLNTAPH